MRRPAVGIIGAGVVGSTLALALAQAGYPIAGVSSRRPASAENLAGRLPGGCPALTAQQVVDRAEIVFLTVPDRSIRGLAESLAWRPGQAAVHCSGLGTTEWLAAAARQGAVTGCLHPLQTFARADEMPARLAETTFALEAEPPLNQVLESMVAALGGHSLRLRAADKAAYHLSAVLVSNYVVTLAKLATDLWADFGVPREEALAALLPLLRGSVQGLAEPGLPDCLTGPVARGDLGTIEGHCRMLRERQPDLLPLYGELGQQTVPVALAKGRIDAQQAEELTATFRRCRATASETSGDGSRSPA